MARERLTGHSGRSAGRVSVRIGFARSDSSSAPLPVVASAGELIVRLDPSSVDFVNGPGNACTGRTSSRKRCGSWGSIGSWMPPWHRQSASLADLPYANSVWMPRRRADRPRVVPAGATNLGLLG